MEGHSVLTCQQSGEWDEAPPSCNIVDCGPPPTNDHLTIEVASASVGSATQYKTKVRNRAREGIIFFYREKVIIS